MNAQRQDSPVREVSIDAMRDDGLSARQDLVVVEEPLEIRIAQAGDTGPGTSLSITMRTPGQDIELARRLPARRRHHPLPRRRRRQPHLRAGRQCRPH